MRKSWCFVGFLIFITMGLAAATGMSIPDQLFERGFRSLALDRLVEMASSSKNSYRNPENARALLSKYFIYSDQMMKSRSYEDYFDLLSYSENE